MTKAQKISFKLRLQVATLRLIQLNGFEESFEVASTKTLKKLNRILIFNPNSWEKKLIYIMITALNDFNEKSWTILHVLSKDLQQVSIFVVIN